jgi:hypothetical protein
MGFQKIKLALQSMGMGAVISVHPGDVKCPARIQSGIQGGYDPLMGLAESSKTTVSSFPATQDLQAFIGRAVVNGNNLEIFQCLLLE